VCSIGIDFAATPRVENREVLMPTRMQIAHSWQILSTSEQKAARRCLEQELRFGVEFFPFFKQSETISVRINEGRLTY